VLLQESFVFAAFTQIFDVGVPTLTRGRNGAIKREVKVDMTARRYKSGGDYKGETSGSYQAPFSRVGGDQRRYCMKGALNVEY
jgi:hypothetical protein